MPVTNIAAIYKTLPSGFADGVSQHVKKRAEAYKVSETEEQSQIQTGE